MDGPQIQNRWSARYASVLADDPGSSVLSMSSFGLINRSNRKRLTFTGKETSQAIALWRDDTGYMKDIQLEEEHHAVVVSLTEYPISETTLDGRSNSGHSTSLRLTGVRQIQCRLDTFANVTKEWNA